MPLIPEYRAIHGTASKSIGEATFARFGLMLRKANGTTASKIMNKKLLAANGFSFMSEKEMISAVDVVKGILNVHLQTAVYVYMKIRNEGLNCIKEGIYAYSSSL